MAQFSLYVHKRGLKHIHSLLPANAEIDEWDSDIVYLVQSTLSPLP